MATIIILSWFVFVIILFLTTGIRVFLCIPKIANGKPILIVIKLTCLPQIWIQTKQYNIGITPILTYFYYILENAQLQMSKEC